MREETAAVWPVFPWHKWQLEKKFIRHFKYEGWLRVPIESAKHLLHFSLLSEFECEEGSISLTLPLTYSLTHWLTHSHIHFFYSAYIQRVVIKVLSPARFAFMPGMWLSDCKRWVLNKWLGEKNEWLSKLHFTTSTLLWKEKSLHSLLLSPSLSFSLFLPCPLSLELLLGWQVACLPCHSYSCFTRVTVVSLL